MFNKQRILDLLECSGKTQRELLDFLGKTNCNGSINSILGRTKNDMKVSNLEKIADFFSVSIDYFFDRSQSVNGVYNTGNGNHIHNVRAEYGRDTIEAQERLLAEKDKRIKLLEEMIEYLRQGRNQDSI